MILNFPIFTYLTRLIMINLVISFLALIIPDIVILSVHWSSDNYYGYLIIMSYLIISSIPVLRKIVMLFTKYRVYAIILLAIYQAFCVCSLLVIYIYCLVKAFGEIKDNPMITSIFYHAIFYSIVLVIVTSYGCVLYVIYFTKPRAVIFWMKSINIFSLGLSYSNIKNIETYEYDIASQSLERFNQRATLSFCEASCNLCNKSYYENEEVVLLDNCNHHFDINCAQKMLTNTLVCPYCACEISFSTKYIY